MTDLDLVKEFVRALSRLGRGDLSAVLLTGLAQAKVERQALVVGLLEDMEPLLKEDTLVQPLADGDIEITRSGVIGDAAVIDVSDGAA